ncbi:hypothetical protein ACWEOO_17325 [Kribbella sp. NPDC004138]
MQTYGRDILEIADELTTAYVEVFTAPPFAHRDPGRPRPRSARGSSPTRSGTGSRRGSSGRRTGGSPGS